MSLMTRKKIKVDPKTIKKRSNYMRQYTDSVQVIGERERTTTGYKVSSFSNGSFETFYEVMLAGTATHRYTHEKKDKVIWVLGGAGFLEWQLDGEKIRSTRRLNPGDHVPLPRKSTYRITTESKTPLELLVTQQVKYAAKLEIVEHLEAMKNATAAEMVSPTESSRGEVNMRRGSKAKQQQVADRASRGREGGGRPPVDPTSPTGFREPAGANFQTGTNARPTGGKFDDAGAG